MAFEKYIEMFKEKLSEKKGTTLEQEEQFKKERAEVSNIINGLSDKGKKLCIEFLTYNSSKFKENDINGENEEETKKIKKIFNIIKGRNYYTKSRLANQICTQYNIDSILLYGVHNAGNNNIKHDLKTSKHIKYMDEKGRAISFHEYDENILKPRYQKEKDKEKKEMQEAMLSRIKEFKRLFHDLSDEGKLFCIEMLKKSYKLLMKSNIICSDKEQKHQKETNKIEQALFYIMLIDENLKGNLINELYEEYNTLITKKSNHKGPRKLSKRKK